MAISSQLPLTVTTPKLGALQALALQAGQIVEAQVIGPALNGGTQVQINVQMLNLLLPTLAQAGETIKFEVQGSGAQLKLALQVPVPPTQAQVTPAPVSAQTPLPMPVATLPLPPASTSAMPLPPSPTPAALPQVTVASTATSLVVTLTPSVVQTPPAINAMPVPQADAALPVPTSTPQGLNALPAAPMATQPPLPPVATPSAPAQPTQLPNAAPGGVAVQGQTPPGQTAVLQPSVAPVSGQAPTAQPLPATPISPLPNPYLQPAKPASEMAGLVPPPAANTTPLLQTPLMSRPLAPAAPQMTSATTPLATTPSTPAPMPVSPQAALSQMVQASLPRQDSVLSLLTALTTIAGKVALPEPVVRAAQQVLAGRMVVDDGKFDGAKLQKAVLASGVFQEASLARGQLPAAQTDMKSTLLALRQTLTTWLGPQAAMAPAAAIVPPLRGQTPRAKTSNPTAIDPAAPASEIGKHLLERTEGALARLRLHQNASLPDAVLKTADWSMDLPVVVAQQQTVLHIQIHREDEPSSNSAVERGWQMRFALTVPQMGEVGAQVSLRGGATGVLLWATERETSDALEGHLVALRQTLAEVGLRPGAVIVRHGEPPTPPVAPSAHVLDERT